MYKITKLKISGFWGSQEITTNLHDDVNVIIGRNGTGKTTLINILQAILTVDVEWLYDYEFTSAEINLTNESSKKTIKITKKNEDDFKLPLISYYISNKKFTTRVIGTDENIPLHFKRRIYEESTIIRQELAEIVSITSLSVYRIKKDYLQERRESAERKVDSPVDLILSELMQKLTTYQLELSNKARSISAKLQKEVLMSLLLDDADRARVFNVNFNKNEEKSKLISAYRRLGIDSKDVKKYINEHIDNVAASIEYIKTAKEIGNKKNAFDQIDASLFIPLEQYQRTNEIVEKSLQAEEEEKEIFKQRQNFISILKRFITDKNFLFDNNGLKVEKNGELPISKLSSGEKQLLILFTETLLQRESSGIFIADEPELSLHIIWQREILPAIRQLNPNCQLIVATHSPEVAGKYSSKIIDMEDIIK